jgi:hypothetical protein
MKWLYRKNLEKATELSSPQAHPLTPIRNLYDTRLSNYMRFSTSGTIEIHITMPGQLEVDAIGIGGHSLGENVSLSVNGGASFPVNPVNALVEVPLTILQSIDIVISAPSIGVGVIPYIGRLEIGKAYEFPGVSSNVKFDEISNSNMILSATRQAYGYRRDSFSRASVQFPLIEREDLDQMKAVFKYVDTFTPFFATFGEECIEGFTTYGILEDTKTLSFQMNEAQVYTSSLSISEVY